MTRAHPTGSGSESYSPGPDPKDFPLTYISRLIFFELYLLAGMAE